MISGRVSDILWLKGYCERLQWVNETQYRFPAILDFSSHFRTSVLCFEAQNSWSPDFKIISVATRQRPIRCAETCHEESKMWWINNIIAHILKSNLDDSGWCISMINLKLIQYKTTTVLSAGTQPGVLTKCYNGTITSLGFQGLLRHSDSLSKFVCHATQTVMFHETSMY